MRILAVGDVHGDVYMEPFRARLSEAPTVDLVLLAGDMTERNDLELFGKVLGAVQAHTDAPIISVFGNEEWSESHAEYRRAFSITFLHDSAKVLDVGSGHIRLVGSTGSLDTPTWWQRTHLPNIYREYAARVRSLDGLLAGDDYRILLTHYAPTYRTLVGEGESWWDQMGSKRLEEVILRRRPELVIHGHAHKGSSYAELRTEQTTLVDFTKGRVIPVHNVAFPVKEDVTILDIPGV
ncbi:MAG: metallophosphoesterase [Thermoplasmata archaeon]